MLRDDRRLRAISVNRKPDEKDAAGPPSRKSGWIDLGRIRLSIAPRAEWRQMLREVLRLQRNHFWNATMSVVDWDAV